MAAGASSLAQQPVMTHANNKEQEANYCGMDSPPGITAPPGSNEVLQDTKEGKRKQGRPRKMWLDKIKEWTRPSVDDLLDSIIKRTPS